MQSGSLDIETDRKNIDEYLCLAKKTNFKVLISVTHIFQSFSGTSFLSDETRQYRIPDCWCKSNSFLIFLNLPATKKVKNECACIAFLSSERKEKTDNIISIFTPYNIHQRLDVCDACLQMIRCRTQDFFELLP